MRGQKARYEEGKGDEKLMGIDVISGLKQGLNGQSGRDIGIGKKENHPACHRVQP
jgi:hypothetical protein